MSQSVVRSARPPRGGRARAWACALLLAVVAPTAAAAQETVCDPGDVEVRRLAFEGNETFDDAELARGIAATPSSWLRRATGLVGTRRSAELRSPTVT